MMQSPSGHIHEVARVPYHVKAQKINFAAIKAMYASGVPLSAIALYDRAGAGLLEEAGIDIAIATFSDGAPLGIATDKTATIGNIVKAVSDIKSCNDSSFVIGDLPYHAYRSGPNDMLSMARQLIYVGADAIKLEGGAPMAATLAHFVAHGIPTIGHIGYTPKTGMRLRVRGRDIEDTLQLFRDAHTLVAAGASALVLELMEAQVAAAISAHAGVPTFSIYSGGGTSGQVIVLNDLLGITRFDHEVFPKGKPKAIGEWEGSPLERVQRYHLLVRAKQYPQRSPGGLGHALQQKP